MGVHDDQLSAWAVEVRNHRRAGFLVDDDDLAGTRQIHPEAKADPGQAVRTRTHRVGRDSGQIGVMGSRLGTIDLLQRQHVGVQRCHCLAEPIEVHPLIGDGPPVQNIECRQPHTQKVAAISTDPASSPVDTRPAMREALRHCASALKAAEVPFALAGSYALWVYGAPEGWHDVDVAVPESAVEDATQALAGAGFSVERPPEDWLFKARRDGAMVDVLHRLVGVPVDEELIAGAELHDVLGIRLPVLEPTVIVITKLLSLSEFYCDFGALLPAVRAVRERVDWDRVRRACADHAYAEGFLFLLERLQIIDRASNPQEPV